jgi:hypothetical protein
MDQKNPVVLKQYSLLQFNEIDNLILNLISLFIYFYIHTKQ